MKTSKWRALLLVAYMVCSSPAIGESTCKFDSAWQCFGIIELKNVSGGETSGTIRMLRFNNGEFGAEIERDKAPKQRLVYLRLAAFYFGVEKEGVTTTLASNPFAFLDLGLHIPILSLHTAFPQGAISVPDGHLETPVAIQVGGKSLTVQVITDRISSTKLNFSIGYAGSQALELPALNLLGSWDGNLPEPLPDDYSLVDWVHRGAEIISTVGEARRASNK
ncbi:MAG: hypothetical protein ACKVN9_03375 [Methylophilaceae bacterium]